MILRDKWIHVRLIEDAPSAVILPEGTDRPIKAEVENFEVLAVGRNVDDVKPGDIVVLMAALGSLMRFRYQGTMYYTTLEGDVIAIMNRDDAPMQWGAVDLTHKE